MIHRTSYLLSLVFFLACSSEIEIDPDKAVYSIPVVFHVLHHGEEIGNGFNLDDATIQRQLEILNEDFRRKPGTRGYNDHPLSDDSGIEFLLASTGPDGRPTTGVNRVRIDPESNPIPANRRFDHYAYYGYWNPAHYLNIWIEPLPESSIDLALGLATGPETDLPGAHLLVRGEPESAEGILINFWHFGETDLESESNLGRTLTHEAGHYLGLLHLWGDGNCQSNDFCEDTPPMSRHLSGCSGDVHLACDGSPAMVRNYMNYNADSCVNIFTLDQIARMHYVLENSPRRKSLLSSPGLKVP